jgi:hypothetical protein
VLTTSDASLSAKVAGKKMKFASVVGYTFTRAGFGVNISITKLKLTKKAAKQLNKKLGFKGKKRNRAGRLVAVKPLFKANRCSVGLRLKHSRKRSPCYPRQSNTENRPRNGQKVPGSPGQLRTDQRCRRGTGAAAQLLLPDCRGHDRPETPAPARSSLAAASNWSRPNSRPGSSSR